MRILDFAVTISSDDVYLGTNELLIGIKPKNPCIINELVFEFDTQIGGALIETQKMSLNSDDRVSTLHTTTIDSNVTRHKIEGLDLKIDENDRITWNVIAIGNAKHLTVRGKGVAA
jgi:hypothetical protein